MVQLQINKKNSIKYLYAIIILSTVSYSSQNIWGPGSNYDCDYMLKKGTIAIQKSSKLLRYSAKHNTPKQQQESYNPF